MMFPALLIPFRETLEVALVVGIVLAFLTKTDQHFFKKYVWRGVAAGIITSIILATILEVSFGGFTGPAEQLFEGILMLVTAALITWMILWVHRQEDLARRIREKIATHVEKGYGIGILILIATSVFREGTETVLYLKASSVIGQSGQITGAVLGIMAAIVLGYAFFRYALRVNLSLIFTVTSVFLIMFAAGLVSHGVHEFQELGILPVFSFDPLFDFSSTLDHRGAIGSFLRTLFGYTSVPTLLELASYTVSILGIIWLKKIVDRRLLQPARQ